MTTHIRRSVCPFDCPDTCGLLVEVHGDRALRVTGDPDHPYTRGFLCPKMTNYERTVHSPDRLTTPLLRTGPKGTGAFRPIPWDEALDLVAERFTAICRDHGAEAILPYSYAGTMGLVQRNAGHPFFHRLGASRLLRTICSPAKDAGWRQVMGDTPACDPDEVADSDLVILWGINAAATNVHFLPAVQQAKRRGAKVWLVDTYVTPTAAVADRIILVRPGSDGALALGLMHVLAREGLLDRPFLESNVQGFGELAELILPRHTPRETARLTGVAEEQVEELARAFAAARAPFIRLGSGLSRYGNGAMTVRTIACLPALTGAYGRPGGGCFPGTSTGAAFPLERITREDLLPGPSRIVNMNRLGHALTELDDPPVMALYVYHSNPAAIAPDQNAVLRGLARPELFTVVHERFMTDTARWADLVLPATSSLEHADLYRSYGSYSLQRAGAVIPPVGESRSNWQVFSSLAQRMGFDDPLFNATAEELVELLLSSPSPWRDDIDRGRLEQGEAVRLVPPPSAGSYDTPSGRIEILNPRAAEPLPRFIPGHGEEGGPYPLSLMTAPSLFCLNSSFNEQEELRRRQEGMLLLLNPGDARSRSISEGDPVVARNDLGEVRFTARPTDRVPAGIAVAEGVWWISHTTGARTVNALTSQRLTDLGEGSTFYDNRVEVQRDAVP